MVRVRPDPLAKFWRHLPLKHPAVFICRKAYETLGRYDLRYNFAMDYDLLLRFYRAGARFSYIEHPLVTIAAGGLNQRHLFRTIGEVRESSVRHGTPQTVAAAIYGMKLMKFLVRRGLSLIGLSVPIDWYRRWSKKYFP